MGGCFAIVSEGNFNAKKFVPESIIYSGEIYETYVNSGLS